MPEHLIPITSIYTDEQGESRFREIEIPLQDAGMIGRLSEIMPASGVIFRENKPDYDWDFHNTPRRQYLIMLDGEIEIETSGGEKRRFCGGDILLLEDTTGKGHRTRHIKQQIRRSVFIPLE